MNSIVKDKKRLILIIITFIILLTGCSEKNNLDSNTGDIAEKQSIKQTGTLKQKEESQYDEDKFISLATNCFKALDAEVSDAPIPYFPYISLQPDKLDESGQVVRAPLEYVLYRYWTNEKLDKDFEKLASFRTNPIWTSDTMDLAAIIPVFSDESRRLFYKESGHIEDPVELMIIDEDSYYPSRGSLIDKFLPEPEGTAGGPAPSDVIADSCKPLVELDASLLFPLAIHPGDEVDVEWDDAVYPFRNVMSLFSGFKDEYLYFYETYVLSYHTDHSKLMNIAAHVYSKDLEVTRVWMNLNGKEIELKESKYLHNESMNTEYWTLYDAEVTSDLFSQYDDLAEVYVELKNQDIRKLSNM
ncbi:hypothetical protein ACE3MQ_19305 [Paenibacillus lentus]|uniref:hypothetical protein n=1 Tax=Paenibacillus lentus TaxID=1338368 RepID=UPI0036617631